MKLGITWQGEPIRLVKVEVDGRELLLATDLEIEGELIAALMRQLLTGKRPGRRAMELIRFYLMGHAELEEVLATPNPRPISHAARTTVKSGNRENFQSPKHSRHVPRWGRESRWPCDG